MDELKIDDVAKACGLTKRTIRYYEELGIFPAPDRSEGGIRIYTREHIDYLQKIVAAKELLGFSLQELVQYLSAADIYKEQHQNYQHAKDRQERKDKLIEMESSLGKRLDMIHEKLEKMKLMQTELETAREKIRQALLKLEE